MEIPNFGNPAFLGSFFLVSGKVFFFGGGGKGRERGSTKMVSNLRLKVKEIFVDFFGGEEKMGE